MLEFLETTAVVGGFSPLVGTVTDLVPLLDTVDSLRYLSDVIIWDMIVYLNDLNPLLPQ